MMSMLIKHGHNPHDLLHVYTVDQVHMYYNYALEDEMHQSRTQAIILAKAIKLNPPMGADARYYKSVYKEFQEMIDSFDPEQIERRRKKERAFAKNPMAFFGVLGIEGAKK